VIAVWETWNVTVIAVWETWNVTVIAVWETWNVTVISVFALILQNLQSHSFSFAIVFYL
jgi:hypothetical protein